MFSDHALECLEKDLDETQGVDMFTINPYKMLALLSRLEAAEKCVELYGYPQCCMDIKIGNRHEECESYFEWLKAKGEVNASEQSKGARE